MDNHNSLPATTGVPIVPTGEISHKDTEMCTEMTPVPQDPTPSAIVENPKNSHLSTPAPASGGDSEPFPAQLQSTEEMKNDGVVTLSVEEVDSGAKLFEHEEAGNEMEVEQEHSHTQPPDFDPTSLSSPFQVEAPLVFSASDLNRRIEVKWNVFETYLATVITFSENTGEIYLVYDDGTCHWFHPTDNGFDSWRFVTDGPIEHTAEIKNGIRIAKLTIKSLEDKHAEIEQEVRACYSESAT
jgi:hypothetical protein